MHNEEEVTPTGRIIIVGAHSPHLVMAGLRLMGVETVQVVTLEMSEDYVKRRLDTVNLDFAKLEERTLAVIGDDRGRSFRTVYSGFDELREMKAAATAPRKNDPYYRREAKGGKRNRRW